MLCLKGTIVTVYEIPSCIRCNGRVDEGLGNRELGQMCGAAAEGVLVYEIQVRVLN